MKTKIQRYCPPTKLDVEPFGTIYHVKADESLPNQIYIQVSNDETPHWERLGVFFEKVFEEFLDEEIFIEECLKLFQNNKNAQFLKIRELIK